MICGKSVPVMLYDGDCGFCQLCIERWQKMTGQAIAYAPYQEMLAHCPQVTEESCRKAVQLIMPDGIVFSGAHAVFKMLSVGTGRRRLLRAYESMPAFGLLCEWCYRLVARCRGLLSKLYGRPVCSMARRDGKGEKR